MATAKCSSCKGKGCQYCDLRGPRTDADQRDDWQRRQGVLFSRRDAGRRNVRRR